MKTKALLVVTAVVESATGVAVLVAPSLVTALLLGARLESPAATVVARVAGAALFSIGLTCWLVRKSPEGDAHTGRIVGLLAYNVAVAALLSFAAVAEHLRGIALWPAVALHAGLSVWCGVSLGAKSGNAPLPRRGVPAYAPGRGTRP
jgi:predicted membrane-bound spermidine synthase